MEIRPVSPQDVSWESKLPALAWADENAGADRTYTLYAAVDRGGERGLVRLLGIDPTKHKGEQKLEWPGQVYRE